MDERQVRFQTACREGRIEIAFTATGTNLQLVVGVGSGNFAADPRDCDFDKEHGKVSAFYKIINIVILKENVYHKLLFGGKKTLLLKEEKFLCQIINLTKFDSNALKRKKMLLLRFSYRRELDKMIIETVILFIKFCLLLYLIYY